MWSILRTIRKDNRLKAVLTENGIERGHLSTKYYVCEENSVNT